MFRYFCLSLFFIFSLHFLPLAAWGQARDFFSNTRGVDRLSTGSAGACPTCPGFNPDRLIRHSGTDPDGAGPITFSQTITTTAPSLGGAVTGPFFNQLGPGAVTDNMFGIISSAGTDPAKCGRTEGLNGLNCGDLRFDPRSQGITVDLIDTSAVDNVVSMAAGSGNFVGDFSPSDDSHQGIDLKNAFVMSRTTATVTEGDLSVTCAVSNFTCFASRQEQHQVTPLQITTNPTTGGLAVTPIAAGTLSSPGSGEQNFNLVTSWSITNSSGPNFAAPRVSWSLQFNDPIRDDNNQPRMDTGVISGSFIYNSPGFFPSQTIPMVRNSTELCRGTAGTAGTCVPVP